MQRATQQERAEAFHRLHTGDGILVLVNAWDAASARLLEQAGSPAIATTSAGVAWSLGYSDGEQVSARALIEACARICRVVTAPVSVDLERGYGRTPTEVAATVRALLELGVVGINIEDGLTPGANELASPDILTEKIAAIRAVANEAGVRLFINARTGPYLAPANDPDARYEEAVRRALMYIAAGADGVFAPGLESLEEMARMTQVLPRPLNIYAGFAGLPSVAELRRAGVRRVSLGCGPLQAALALVRRIATESLNEGTYTVMTTDMLSLREANSLFSQTQQSEQG
jgi:2-methylisocitrate lyase-like PEP mutase family enzyme